MISMDMQVLLQSCSLRYHTFDGCCITREIVECLTLALNSNGSTLTCLWFNHCEFLDEDPGLREIANALRANTSLTHLKYDADEADSTEHAFIAEMKQVLRDNTTLTDLHSCFLGIDGDSDGIPQIITALGAIRH
jgi:hypothetical protein